MIESIQIAKIATFPNVSETMSGLSQFNFIFGSNGSGKTTISRVVANESAYPTCSINWKGGTRLQPMVYNRDFVDRNFNPSTELKGVFTLGEQQTETLAKIASSKKELDDLADKIETLNKTLKGEDGTKGKQAELESLNTSFKEKCWNQKKKHDAKLQGGFEGCRNSAEKFKARVLQELEENESDLLSLADLEKKSASIFGPSPIREATVVDIDFTNLLGHEENAILSKRVIGKEDVDIAAMIKRLENSDWVSQGRVFFEANNGNCPFCQQSTDTVFENSLNEYFNETFLADSKTIEDLATNYSTDTLRAQQEIDTIIATPSNILDVEKLKVEKQLIDSKITINLQRITDKNKEASRVIELDSLSNVASSVKGLIDAANAKVKAHNAILSNLTEERKTLIAQIWKFVLEELKVDISSYTTQRDNLQKAINGLTGQIKTSTSEKTEKAIEIRDLEKQTTSVQPTIDAINGLLTSFGFQSFSLAKASKDNCYKLVRSDGSDAQATLSEGEKTFVTFLYFYHLLKGSNSESGMTNDRVVVFDDPVSSLDSDILFIVGSLIKGVLKEVRNNIGHIKQVFVLTHNVYFHKEVAFNPKRPKDSKLSEESFWIIRKLENASKIESHKTNPIKTSYELLWTEVRRKDRSNLTIQNTLRRILENYFKILGGVDPDKICNLFNGKEKLICNSLFSWVNDGSHFAHDDLFVTLDSSAIEIYLKVFRAIFEESNHAGHYKMMMSDAFVEEFKTSEETATEPTARQQQRVSS